MKYSLKRLMMFAAFFCFLGGTQLMAQSIDDARKQMETEIEADAKKLNLSAKQKEEYRDIRITYFQKKHTAERVEKAADKPKALAEIEKNEQRALYKLLTPAQQTTYKEILDQRN